MPPPRQVAPAASPALAPKAERIRTTVSVDPEVLAVFRCMADTSGVSVSRCMGDWLADTADGAQLVTAKLVEAKRAPVTVLREIQAMMNGYQGEVSDVLDHLRQARSDRAGGRIGAAGSTGGPVVPAPSSNTGLKSPPRAKRKP